MGFVDGEFLLSICDYLPVSAILKKFREQYVEGLVSRKKDLLKNLHEVMWTCTVHYTLDSITTNSNRYLVLSHNFHCI